MRLKQVGKPWVILSILAALLISFALLAPINQQAGDGLWRFLGRFHILVLHFPIVLLLLAPLLSLFTHQPKFKHLSAAIGLIWWLGSIAVFTTVSLGLMLAANEGFAFETVKIHLTSGLSVALLAFLCTYFHHLIQQARLTNQTDNKNNKFTNRAYQVSCICLISAVFVAAHAGGNLVHGETYLTRYAPEPLKPFLPADKQAIEIADINDQHFIKNVRPLLEQYCFDCHGSDMQKAGVQLNVLDPDFAHGNDAPNWHAALDMLNSGQMPPPKKNQPSDDERRIMVDWLTQGIQIAKEMKKSESKQVIRRLTKQQYTNTLQDLLGINIEFGAPLPNDPLSEMGFSNNAELLKSSSLHLEYFQKIARNALDKAINLNEKPAVSHYRMTFGKGIGKGQATTRSRGYMDVPLDPQDFYVEFLNENAQRQTSTQDEKLTPYFSASLRGSDPWRFQLKQQGITLYSALPHTETTAAGKYGAWNGPSPNLSLQVKDQFPREGDFIIRVKARKGDAFKIPAESAISLNQAQPLAKLDSNFTPIKPNPKDPNITLVNAKNIKTKTGLKPSTTFKRVLVVDNAVANNERSEVSAKLNFTIQGKAYDYFQLDLVHPEVAADSMANVYVEIDGHMSFNAPIYPTGKAKLGQPVVSSLGVVYLLRAKKHTLTLSGDSNFPGFSDLVFSKVDSKSEVAKTLQINYLEDAQDASAIPELIPYIGTRTDDGMDYKTLAQSVQVKATEQSEVYTFQGRLENFPTPLHGTQGDHITSSSLKIGVWNNNLVKNESHYGSPLHIDYIEFEAPYLPEWPSKTHKNIFIESTHQKDSPEYAREVIQHFMNKAFRRPVKDTEVDLYFNYWQSIAADYPKFEASIKETLVGVLSSSHFLYLAQPTAVANQPENQTSGELAKQKSDAESAISQLFSLPKANATPVNPDAYNAENNDAEQAFNYALASRLSYFLWNSPPDETLINLAKQGQLSQLLPQQLNRMINQDEKLFRFIKVFAKEWLRIDRQQGQHVDVSNYPDYTRFVKQDMALETEYFLKALIQDNLSVLNLIDSDFAMLNQNLAEFYGIEGVVGNQFRKVNITDSAARGGLLTQGAFLTGHADGVHSHPVKRAVWLKMKILGDTPPPPPPNVPALDPETPGFEKLTLKQQLEMHRDKESCRDCHAKIDPYGIVFEQFDAVGRPRTEFKGTKIDANSILPDGTAINGVSEIQQYLLNVKSDQVVLSVIKHLFSYALGREISFHDDEEIKAILEKVKQNNYKMQSLLEAIITSPSFMKA